MSTLKNILSNPLVAYPFWFVVWGFFWVLVTWAVVLVAPHL